MPPIEVRRAAPGDHPAIATLTADTYLTERWADEDYAPELRDVAGRDELAQVWVALDEHEIVGAVTIATRGGPLAELAVAGEAVMRHLVTAPAARGRGVATSLVQACLDLARADGCRVLRLSTHRKMTSAHRLYGRFGFTRTPCHDWEPFPGMDLITYALALVPYCDQCGQDLLAADHPHCQTLRELDPPRWCPQCRRRMVVQVVPTGWSARCVEHGVTTSR